MSWLTYVIHPQAEPFNPESASLLLLIMYILGAKVQLFSHLTKKKSKYFLKKVIFGLI